MDILIGTKENIAELQHDKITMVVFTSSTCAPCARYMGIIKQFADNCTHNISIIAYDAYADQDFPRKCKLRDLPTTVVFVHTKLVQAKTGCLKLADLEDFVNQSLWLITAT